MFDIYRGRAGVLMFSDTVTNRKEVYDGSDEHYEMAKHSFIKKKTRLFFRFCFFLTINDHY